MMIPLIIISVIAVLFIVLFAVSNVKAKKAKEVADDLTRKMDSKDLDIKNLEVDLKKSKTENSNLSLINKNLNNSISELKKEIENYQNSKVIVADTVPEKLQNTNINFSDLKQFKSCWMKLQNEAFKNGILKSENNIIFINVIK